MRLFEIAVYRISPEQWDADLAAKIQAARNTYFGQVPKGYEPRPADIAHHERTWIEWAGGNRPFAYNQAVGWIRVESQQWAIKAYAHRTEQKRVQSGVASAIRPPLIVDGHSVTVNLTDVCPNDLIRIQHGRRSRDEL